MESHQAKPQHHERKGRPVVERCFSRQGKPQPLPISGLGHLDVRGKDGIGRCQDRPEQNRRPK